MKENRAKELLSKIEPIGFFEMAINLRSTQTGLPKLVWVSTRTPQHGPRIKIGIHPIKAQSLTKSVTMTIADSPKVIGGIPKEISQSDINITQRWIILNKETLLKYWRDEISSDELLRDLKKI